VKGFQIAKGEYVLFDKEELDAVGRRDRETDR
jgi:non-homologous end joining protein Ku